MNLIKLTPKKSLNKALLKIKPTRGRIDEFKANFIEMIENINPAELEEYHKNLVSSYLQKTYFSPSFFINTKGRNDLVIHTGKDPSSHVGVIIETKKPTNKTEMVSIRNLNVKAFHELLLYYLRERIKLGNIELKQLIITNIYEWFIFDAALFEKLFANNNQLVQNFINFDEGRLVDKSTDFFCKEIAKPFIDSIESDITFTHFDIRDYNLPLRNNDKKDDLLLVSLFKVLSPEHLLKLSFANDSNTLDKEFYAELLYLIGLEEINEGNRKLIQRRNTGSRFQASIIENSILQIDTLDKMSTFSNSKQYGDNYEEQLFGIALELAITWINRILFLKLLESQLINYHNGDKSYSFLNSAKVKSFADLNSLFFNVLAKQPNERSKEIVKQFGNIPYLNSSLFEPTDIEHSFFFISQLRHSDLPIFHHSVLKESTGKKRTGNLNILEYLFSFLDSYDFSSEGTEDIQEDNKALINASVLGLIFEKINGYKEGSFFTPGAITMYICKQTIQKAVVQKFNDKMNWKCNNIIDLHNNITNIVKANEIINSIKICDPAVGSGHFLVSALNELIALKSELRILSDKKGRLLRDYHIEVVNDDLIITDSDGNFISYNPNSNESQRIQEAIFHEKQTIIENCLFGIDINPNSVKICRLRLWIELLKHSYYKKVGNSSELETLPNIDINIKCGNSLVNRYPLNSDIKRALRKSKWDISSYRLAIMAYRNATDKSQKREMLKLIESIKNDFVSEISFSDPKMLKLSKIKGELYNLTNQTNLFALSDTEKSKWQKKVNILSEQITTLEKEINDIKSNRIYENSFEWRFEFPEVLNNAGDYVGFDAIIGNPPYITYHGRRRTIISNDMLNYFKTNYLGAITDKKDGKYNSAMFFIEKAAQIGAVNSYACLITDISFYEHFYAEVKKLLVTKTLILEVVNGLTSFENVGSGQLILLFKRVADDDASISKNTVQVYQNGIGSNSVTVKQIIWKNSETKYQFYLPQDSDNSIIDKVQADSHPLVFFFPNKLIRTGESVGVKEKGFVCEVKDSNDKVNVYDYLEGSKSIADRFAPPVPTRFFRFDIPLLNKRNNAYRLEAEKAKRNNPKVLGIGDQLAFDNPKVLIRQSCDHLCCTFTKKPFIYNRSFYSISNINSSGKSSMNLLFILGLLNSKLFTYYATKKRIIRKEAGKQPQIRLGDIKNIPISDLAIKKEANIVAIVKAILDSYKSNSSDEIAKLEAKLNLTIYKIYGLSDSEIAAVEKESI